jgi:hypothetical protein
MKTHVSEVFVEALSMPARSRAELAQKLLASLESEISSPEIETAWKSEALDRCTAYDEGKMSERDSADVLRDAYRRVK